MLLAGGIMQRGFQCGQVWGAALAAGTQAYRLFGPGPKAEAGAIIAAQRIVESFHTRYDAINCIDITDIDKSSSTMKMIMFFLIKGGAIRCFHMAGKYAPVAFDEINTALSGTDIKAPAPPVSCAALLAQKMGASDKHQAMAAGFGGGIGLSGGACGALGAAIWIIAMRRSEEESGKIGFNDPKATDAIERFLKCTGNKFECSKIVGRKFKNIDDHARFLRDGGCSEIIEALAAE